MDPGPLSSLVSGRSWRLPGERPAVVIFIWFRAWIVSEGETDDAENPLALRVERVPGGAEPSIQAGTPPFVTVRSRMPRVARRAASGRIGKMSRSFQTGSIVDQS